MKLNSIDAFGKRLSQKYFYETTDRLLELVSKDYKLLAWICWGLDLLYTDYSYEQMLEYIGQSTEEDIRKRIAPSDPLIDIKYNFGLFFEIQFRMYDDDGKDAGYFNLENRIHPFGPLMMESLSERDSVFLFSLLFWEKRNEADLDIFKCIPPTKALWVLSESPPDMENSLEGYQFNPYNGRLISFGEKSESSKRKAAEASEKLQLRMQVDQYYLGNPSNLRQEDFEGSPDWIKRAYLMLLLDTLFRFGIKKEERLKIAAERFNLRGPLVKKEADVMNSYDLFRKVFYHKGMAEGKAKEKQKIINNLTNSLRKIDSNLSERQAKTLAKNLIKKNFKK